MRPVLHGDVTSVARALLLVKPEERRAMCAQIFDQADLAGTYVQQHGRLHRLYGNGSLMAAARKYPLGDEPTFDNIDYCGCVMTVLGALMARSTCTN
ncbi:hypothetical protein DL239_11560 [Sedimentitalea sp. CY04]|uniref:DUF7742 domain-containing protein n=1 Tax=Parasedimentitalea denitrificans TaxID=2211118 RepID=A0ABX0W7H6_9RHOB|nr:hypothetical protein [Sedimentitalea sp. CY04]NIZ61613.1 hypothetical protein [Sedimentitalea sp. CY04]